MPGAPAVRYATGDTGFGTGGEVWMFSFDEHQLVKGLRVCLENRD
ncbi:hypothetical protein Daudx_1978 [Candidatus Desulforudis audaxviator]|nr:hypothetical protein Daudx_1978 [Candidatus Desulforudis audaxviator]